VIPLPRILGRRPRARTACSDVTDESRPDDVDVGDNRPLARVGGTVLGEDDDRRLVRTYALLGPRRSIAGRRRSL
jgi:hypothetical protein